MTEIKDPYRIENAEVCFKCDEISFLKKGGIRMCICGKCRQKAGKMITHWRKYGLYAGKKET